MANILNMGTTALVSLQKAISTTGHNITNVNTDGYSRQRVVFDTLNPQYQGGMFFGSGVGVSSVERLHDQFLTQEVRGRTSSTAQYDTLASMNAYLDNILADSKVGLAPAVNRFFSAMDEVASDPSSLPQRQVLLGEAQNLADRFRYLDDTINSVSGQINTRINANVTQINSLASDIANLNGRIASSRIGPGNGASSDLLDERDRLLDQLAKHVGITTVPQTDGAINVMIGTGQALVAGSHTETLTTFTDPYDSEDLLVSVGGSNADISRLIKGGELGAVFEFRNGGLANARSQIGLVAMGITGAVNQQNRLGQDLDGNFGDDLFTPLEPSVVDHPQNTGTASVAASVSDHTGLTGDNYSLYYDGSQYVLTNITTKVSQTGAGPFTVDGVTITPSGAANTGDRFLINTATSAARDFEVAFTRPEAIAAAAPLRSEVTGSNLGTGQIELQPLADVSALPLASDAVFTFDPDALGVGVPGFVVSGGLTGGPLAYNPATDSDGVTFTLSGVSVELSGVPQDGDSLRLVNNTGGVGDNRNALAMAQLQTNDVLRGSTASFSDVYGGLVAEIGVSAQRAQNSADSETVLLNEAKAAKESVSGVNLDEEAANLLRFQQAYQAAAQVITVADQMFQTLLSATRR